MILTTELIVRIIVCVVVSLILWLMSRGNWAAGNRSKKVALFVVGVVAWVGVVGIPVYTQMQEVLLEAQILEAVKELKDGVGSRELAGPLALYPFHEKDRERSPLGDYLSERMIAPLMRIFSESEFVEKKRLEDALKELKFHSSDLTDKDTICRAGKMVGAKCILVGTITVRPDDRFGIFFRLMNVETGKLVSSVNRILPYSPKLRAVLTGGTTR